MKTFLFVLLGLLSVAYSSECVVKNIQYLGSVDEIGKLRLSQMVGESCATVLLKVRDYVNDLTENGCVFASAKTDVDSLGNVTVFVNRGNAFVWAAAENAEDSKSRKETFARLSGLSRGALVRLSDLDRAKRKLVNSGYFESTGEPRLFRDSVRNRIVPVFFMRDLAVNSFEGMLSYASGEDDGWAGNINLNLVNMRGTGRDLSVNGETGEWERSLSAAYKEPWLFGSGWNGILRGNFEQDSSFRTALLEVGVSRMVGFFFEFAVLGGIGNDRWTYTLETKYKNEDRVILPRHGVFLSGAFRVIKDRTDSSHSFTTDLHAEGRVLTPIVGNFVLQTGFFTGTLIPTDRDFRRQDLFSLGGMANLKGYRPGFFRTRAYGVTEADLQWHAFEKTAFHIFGEPTLYRAQKPNHGWMKTFSYGLGISQYRGYWSFSLYYALHNGADAMEGLLHFGVKALF